MGDWGSGGHSGGPASRGGGLGKENFIYHCFFSLFV